MKITNLLLMLLVVMSVMFATNSHAKGVKSKGYSGHGSGYVGGTTRATKSKNGGISIGHSAVVIRVDHKTGKVSKKIFGFFNTKDEAQSAANKGAREEARKSLKEGKALNKKESKNLWQKFVSLFKKKNKGVMAGPDGEGDVVIWGSWPQPGEAPDIVFQN